MVSWMYSVIVGMAGDSESSRAKMTGMNSTVGRQLHATGGEQAAPDEQRLLRRPATIGYHPVTGS